MCVEPDFFSYILLSKWLKDKWKVKKMVVKVAVFESEFVAICNLGLFFSVCKKKGINIWMLWSHPAVFLSVILFGLKIVRRGHRKRKKRSVALRE